MLIKALSGQIGVSTKAIRYYESIGLMPPPKRGENNYRQYTEADVDRLRFIAGSRSLDFSLAEIGEILAARDHGIAPCQRVLDTMAHSLEDVDRRIAELLELRETLTQMHQAGAELPLDDVQGQDCVCYLVKSFPETREVVITHYATNQTDFGRVHSF